MYREKVHCGPNVSLSKQFIDCPGFLLVEWRNKHSQLVFRKGKETAAHGHDGNPYLLSMAGPCRGHKDCKGASILGCCLRHSEIFGHELPTAVAMAKRNR